MSDLIPRAQALECTETNHVWTSPVLADDWHPERDRKCDCGAKTWGEKLDNDWFDRRLLSGYPLERI